MRAAGVSTAWALVPAPVALLGAMMDNGVSDEDVEADDDDDADDDDEYRGRNTSAPTLARQMSRVAYADIGDADTP